MEIFNRKAKFDYFIEEEYEAGIALTGTEIKSVRNGHCNIKDSYGILRNNEIFLLNMFIGQYKEGNIFNHNETRNRKLLLHKYEISKIAGKINEQGYTLVPLEVYFKGSLVKVEIGLAKGKKKADKRVDIKKKDQEREARRDLKMQLR